MQKRRQSGFILLALILGVAALLWLAAAGHQPAAAGPPSHGASAIVASFERHVQTDGLQKVNAQENAVSAINEEVLLPWQESWSRHDGTALSQLFTEDVAFPDLSQPLPAPWRTKSQISEHTWKPSRGVLGRSDATTAAVAYLSSFQKVEFVSLQAWAADLEASGSRATLLLHVDVRGTDRQGRRRHDRGFADGVFTHSADGWHLAGLSLREVETLLAPKPVFEDVTDASGLSAMPTYLRTEAIRRGGYAVAVGDYDNDGRPDIYVGAHGAGKLYRNMGRGLFRDVTEASGLGSDTLVKAAAFVDLRNRGRKDLVLSRFAKDGSDEVLVYENQGNGRFVRRHDALTRVENYDKAMPMSIADFNHDGFLDLYVGFPGANDFTVLNMETDGLIQQGVFLNQGDGTFVDVTQRSRLTTRLNTVAGHNDAWNLQRMEPAVFPHASVAADWDGNGTVDLTIIDDRRHGIKMYRVQPDDTFSEVSQQLGIRNDGWGMGVAVGDYDGDGLQDLYVTNVDFLAAKRIASRLPAEQSLFNGNHLFHNMGNNHFRDVADQCGLGWTGEGAGGATWLDYDNDGNLDLYVANGLWTGSGRSDFSSLFVRNFVAERQQAGQKRQAASHQVMSDFSTLSLQSENSGHLVMHVLGEYRKNAGSPTLSMGGWQRNCLFRNNGDGTFTEVAYLLGADRMEDGYVPATLDYDQDGRTDILLRNADPGTRQKQFGPLVLLHNTGSWGNHYLTVTLQGNGTTSNRDAVGATVWLLANGKRQSRQIQTLVGASQSEMKAHFGLGSAKRVDELKVRWPSGHVQTLHGLAVDRDLKLVEPQGE